MVTLTNIGTSYDLTQPSHGLGLGLVDLTGVTSVTFHVRVQKVGAGTQSWQLWNQTDGTEVGVINDAGAAGIKDLEASFSVALTGVKLFRVRGKSTTASDDPVFFGAAVLLVRP